MPPQDAANNLIHKIKESAHPVLASGQDALVPIILDGENAWEYYPHSGREFLRRFYDALQREPGMEAVTVSEAIARHKEHGAAAVAGAGFVDQRQLQRVDWSARRQQGLGLSLPCAQFLRAGCSEATEKQRKLAFEELLIGEGSDWNWWYGPEHHSANDRDFDELYRKHLSNVYQALGGTPPDYLAQPIAGGRGTAFVYVADRLHSSEGYGRHGALFRMDGRGALRGRPALGRHARQAVSDG